MSLPHTTSPQARPDIRPAGPARPVGSPRPTRRILPGLASVALAGLLIGFVLPRVAGVHWSQIWQVITRLSLWQAVLLAAVWLVGLIAYTFVMTGALPGLGHRQALTLNLAGSAVSNTMPFGGALGMALNLAMVRSWGFRDSSFALFTLVTGLWNVLAKLALPTVALAILVITGRVANHGLDVAAATSSAVLAAVLGCATALLFVRRGTRGLGRLVPRVSAAGARVARGARSRNWARQALAVRRAARDLLRRRWHRLTAGMATYLALQALLLWLILHMLGSTLTPVQVLAGFSVGRALTSAAVTPGGVGVSEAGAAGVLVGLGGDPAITAAAVLLFSGYVFFLEIPVGALTGLAWAFRGSGPLRGYRRGGGVALPRARRT